MTTTIKLENNHSNLRIRPYDSSGEPYDHEIIIESHILDGHIFIDSHSLGDELALTKEDYVGIFDLEETKKAAERMIQYGRRQLEFQKRRYERVMKALKDKSEIKTSDKADIGKLEIALQELVPRRK